MHIIELCRFSDADEVEVGRGWAVDRVVSSDGTVSYEATAPRRARAAYRAVVRLVIRALAASTVFRIRPRWCSKVGLYGED